MLRRFMETYKEMVNKLSYIKANDNKDRVIMRIDTGDTVVNMVGPLTENELSLVLAALRYQSDTDKLGSKLEFNFSIKEPVYGTSSSISKDEISVEGVWCQNKRT